MDTASNKGTQTKKPITFFSNEQNRIKRLRHDVGELTDMVCATRGVSPVDVFTELKKRQGVAQADADADDLEERLDILQAWLVHGITNN